MIRVNQLKLPVDHTEMQFEQKLRKVLNVSAEKEIAWKIAKRSLDARKKPELFYVYSIDVTVDNEEKICRKVHDKNIMLTTERNYRIPSVGTARKSPHTRPVIAGVGPAGLFCAYALALAGVPPIVIERGKPVEERQADVARFWETGLLDPSSNVQFGEGGAGTFSDGKLNTLVKDPAGRNRFVLETFVKFGAPEEILYDAKPHIGTDVLTGIIKRMRKAMEEMGVTFCFSTCLTDYRAEGGRLAAIRLEQNHRTEPEQGNPGGPERRLSAGNHPQAHTSRAPVPLSQHRLQTEHGAAAREIPTDPSGWFKTGTLVLAIGHSARDTFRMLASHGELDMEAKAFAVGLRVEHPQHGLDLLQYGSRYAGKLPAAPYKVTARAGNGRGVYSFCMCPGGYVVNASSQPGRLAVNGMSYAGRNGANANSAIIVSVTPEDYIVPGDPGEPALAGVRFQERLEQRAYELGGGRIPQQLFSDFRENWASTGCGSFESARRGAGSWCNLRGLFSTDIENAFLEGMERFGRTLPGFDRPDAILSGVESRTSSPVRIVRNERLMAPVHGIYPCGEGAGYAGGIMSAAMDGLKVAEAIIEAQTEEADRGR